MTDDQTTANQTSNQDRQSGTHLKTHRDSGCFAKLFRNDGQRGPYITISIGRTFVDAATGDFRDTNTFRVTQARNLLALLKDALDDATDYEAEMSDQPQG